MQVITVQGFDQSILDITRGALVDGVTSTGDLLSNYAKAMEQSFNRLDINGNIIALWFDLRGKDAKGVKGERAKFVQAMMDRSPKFIKETKVNADGTVVRVPTATVDTYWARVKAESGYVANGKVSGTSDVDAKTAAELKTMINRILDAEEDGKDVHASTILESLKSAYFVLVGESFDAGK
jgi:hypothetical protein